MSEATITDNIQTHAIINNDPMALAASCSVAASVAAGSAVISGELIKLIASPTEKVTYPATSAPISAIAPIIMYTIPI